MATVMTVTGPVAAANLGVTLTHEHVFIDLLAEYRETGLLSDPALAVAELGHFVAAGGATIVDATTAELGRRPEALRDVALAAGVNVVAGTGHYRDPYLDRAWFDRHDPDSIADGIVTELRAGIDGSDVRAGIIGEIGCDRPYLSAAEERSFRGAARAHQRTGVTISTHAARWPVGLAQLDLLAEEGVDPARVVIGHCDTVPDPEYPLAVARGCSWTRSGSAAAAGKWRAASPWCAP